MILYLCGTGHGAFKGFPRSGFGFFGALFAERHGLEQAEQSTSNALGSVPGTRW